MDLTRLVFSGTLCTLGLVFGVLHLLRRPTAATMAVWEKWDTPAGAERRRRRRRLGAGIVVLISLAFFVGANFLSPDRSPLAYLIYWALVVLLVLWLCGLAMADIVAIRRVQRRMLASMRQATSSRADDPDQTSLDAPSTGESDT